MKYWYLFIFRGMVPLMKLIMRFSGIEALPSIIVHLTAVLTMSPRLAAATEDSQWVEIYHHFEPQLNPAIREAIKIGARLSIPKSATRAGAANSRLVQTENRAFAFDLILAHE